MLFFPFWLRLVSQQKTIIYQCLVFPHRYDLPLPAWRLRLSWKWEVNQTNKQKSQEQIKMFCISESEAESVVGLSKMTFVEFLPFCTRASMSLCASICKYTCHDVHAFYVCASDWKLLQSPTRAWEILTVIHNLFSCQTGEQRNIKFLCTHCGGRSSVRSFCFLLPIVLLLPFSPVHVPTMLFEVLSNNKADCMLRLS